MTANVRQNQCTRIVEYIRAGGSIHRVQAASIFIFELAARIKNLEDAGFIFGKNKIELTNPRGDSCRLTKYTITYDPWLAEKQPQGSQMTLGLG